MNAAAGLAPASILANQALRLRRFSLAAFSYVLATTLVAIAWALGKVPASTLLGAAAAFIASNIIFYAVIRSGFNLRFNEPSLTRVQIVVAITILMYIVYHMDEGRSAALFGCFIVFLFGIFRLDARQFIGVTLYTLAAYALVILLLMHLRPEAIRDPRGDLLSWLVLAGFLPCFVIIGAQINALRREMRASRSAISALTQMASDYYWQTDADHRFTGRAAADGTSEKVSMFRQGPRMGQTRWDFPSLSPDEAGWRTHRADLDAHRAFRGFELSRTGDDGTERYMSVSGDPVFDDAGRFHGYRGVATDITARKRTEQALRDNAENFRLFADSVPAMAASWDNGLRCRFANKPFMAFFGLSVEDLVGRSVRELAGETVYAEVEGHYAQVLRGLAVTYHRIHTLPDGEPRSLEVKLLPQLGANGAVQGCFEVMTDITEHRLAEQRIQQAANHDGLTGLPNRMLFQDRLESAIALARRESRSFGLLYLDLDRFKPVNDTLGHAVGDELLMEVGRRIRGQVRESDTVARVGGDEFTVLLQGLVTGGRAQVVARKIIAALEVPFELEGGSRSVSIGASVGIALYPADGHDAASLVRAADAAMYRAKVLGARPA
jgi:diguanylate cyclase (GGDEF)-like protein/PAS domain S-box-containing protein